MTLQQIENSKKDFGWDLGNKILYDLCRNNFTHDTADKVLAKTWLIGRSYSVALERRKNKINDNEEFYLNTVVNTFIESKLDIILKNLLNYNNISIDNLPKILFAHKYLTEQIFKITELEKRSFSSKYLHFHLPELFYIYDSRAVSAIRLHVPKLPNELRILAEDTNYDKEYSHFSYKCFWLQKTISEKYNVSLTPRQLDNFLLNTKH